MTTRRRVVTFTLVSALCLSACTAISYKPALSLGPSPVKIPVKLQVETFVDQSPSEDRLNAWEGHRLPSPIPWLETLGRR